MPILRINQHPGAAENRYRIEVSAEDIPGLQPQSRSTEITTKNASAGISRTSSSLTTTLHC